MTAQDTIHNPLDEILDEISPGVRSLPNKDYKLDMETIYLFLQDITFSFESIYL